MQNGTILRLTEKGFGFITFPGADKDLFFHSEDLIDVAFDDLREGDKVTFEVTEGDRGPKAINVSRTVEGASEEAAA